MPAGEENFESKRPVEANKNDGAGIDARNKAKETWPPGESVREHHHEKPTMRLVPIHHRPIPPSRSQFVFVLRPIQRARRCPGRYRGRDVATSRLQRGRLLAVTLAMSDALVNETMVMAIP